jgi:hypothetical protein
MLFKSLNNFFLVFGPDGPVETTEEVLGVDGPVETIEIFRLEDRGHVVLSRCFWDNTQGACVISKYDSCNKSGQTKSPAKPRGVGSGEQAIWSI